MHQEIRALQADPANSAARGWLMRWFYLTLAVTLGGIAQKLGVVDGRIGMRKVLSVTLSFDHDIVDGAPAARFARRFVQLVEEAYGLAPLLMFMSAIHALDSAATVNESDAGSVAAHRPARAIFRLVFEKIASQSRGCDRNGQRIQWNEGRLTGVCRLAESTYNGCQTQ